MSFWGIKGCPPEFQGKYIYKITAPTQHLSWFNLLYSVCAFSMKKMIKHANEC